ncbi:MAG: hypothetical protein B6229_06370 [Spirochaetaceae bacterium 4572_7]|nr:MAG: hypothetical protein B6229_06370 [Spirochaetaceae bacterium 4572_7]
MLPYVNKEIIIFITSLLLIGIATAIDLTVPYLTKIAIDDGISANKDPIVLVDKGGVVIEGQKYKKIKATELGDISDVYYLKYSDGQNYLVSDNEILSITKDQYLRFREADKSLVFRITLILIGLLVVKFIFSFASVYMLSVASQNIIYSIRSDLYEHMLSLSLKFFDRNPIGRLVTRVTSDMDNISKLFTDVLITVLKDLFLIGGAVFVMLSLDYKLGLIAMATLPLVILISMIFRHFARSVQRDVKIKLAKINASLSESINGMNLIQIFNREKLSQEEFDIKNRDFLKTSLQETKLYALFRPGIHLMSGISLGLILLFGGFSSVSGVLEIGVLVAFFQYINHLFRPISDLAEKFNIFQSSMASSERVFMLLQVLERQQ